MQANPTPALSIEWRVVLRSPRAGIEDHVIDVETEDEARERAALEAADYPHYIIWVDSRYVTPWARSGAPLTGPPRNVAGAGA